MSDVILGTTRKMAEKKNRHMNGSRAAIAVIPCYSRLQLFDIRRWAGSMCGFREKGRED